MSHSENQKEKAETSQRKGGGTKVHFQENETSGKATEKTSGKATEKTSGKATEKTSGKTTEKKKEDQSSSESTSIDVRDVPRQFSPLPSEVLPRIPSEEQWEQQFSPKSQSQEGSPKTASSPSAEESSPVMELTRRRCSLGRQAIPISSLKQMKEPRLRRHSWTVFDDPRPIQTDSPPTPRRMSHSGHFLQKLFH